MHNCTEGREILTQLIAERNLDCDERTIEWLSKQACKLLEREQRLWGGNKEEFWHFLQNNAVVLTDNDYLRAAVVSLKLVHRFRSTDFGTSRQRDFGQKWSDAIHGLLGEIALVEIVRKKTEGKLVLLPDASSKDLEDALTTDIGESLLNGVKRKLKNTISIKTTKLEGYWLDVPYNQVKKSHLFVLMKVGADRKAHYDFLVRHGAIELLIKKYAEMRNKHDEQPIFVDEERALIEAREFAQNPDPGVYLAVLSGWQKREQLDKPFEAVEHNANRQSQKKEPKITVWEGIGFVDKGKGLFAEAIKLKGVPTPMPEELKRLTIRFHPIGEFSSSRHALCSLKLLNRDIGSLIKEMGAECDINDINQGGAT